jgi:hypothetical protein
MNPKISLALVASSWLFGFAIRGADAENPAEHLPPHITQVTFFGERAD